MDDKSVEQIKKLISHFRLLMTKVRKDNQMKTKNLKETNQVLEVCRKDYQKLHHENETLKKKNYSVTRRIAQMSKSTQKSTYVHRQKIIIIIINNLKNIEFDEDKIKKLFATQKKKKRHHDYNYYSDETDIESEDEHTNNEPSNDEVIIKKKRKH